MLVKYYGGEEEKCLTEKLNSIQLHNREFHSNIHFSISTSTNLCISLC